MLFREPEPALFPYTTLFRSIFVVLRCPLDRQEPALAPLYPDLGLRLQFEGRLIQTSEPNLDQRVTGIRSEEHTSELQSQFHLVCRLLLEKKNKYRAECSLG